MPRPRPPATGSLPEDGPLDVEALFGRAAPLELEIGFGKGHFLVQAAGRRPDRDFLGIEQAGALVRKVEARVARSGLSNVRLLRAEARDVVARRLPPGCLRRVHVRFPDPWPKRRHAKHRLFSGDFASDLAEALEPGGDVLLATDHDPYFREVARILAAHPAFVRVTPDAFAELPTGGFDAIFGGQGIPTFHGCWQRAAAGP